MSGECDLQSSPKQHSPHRYLYKQKDLNWKMDMRKNFMRRLHDDRQKIFSRGHNGFETHQTDLLIDNIIKNEISTLRLSENLNVDELNEAIEEFERIRDEIIQHEIDTMMAYERGRLEDLADRNDSDMVLCPKCQLCDLDFPDRYTLNCRRCGLQMHLEHQLPSPSELILHFTKIFTSHSGRGCFKIPSVQLQGNSELFIRCDQCTFDARIF